MNLEDLDPDDLEAIAKGTHPEFIECDNCGGYGSSCWEDAEKCTKCGGGGVLDRDEADDGCPDLTYSKKCDRCGRGMGIWSMSYFNTEEICDRCQKLEREHPQYEEAKRIETEECKKGNYKYSGIGLPEDLRIKSKR